VQEQALAYYPYGGTRINTGTVNVPYKYTGKELDASTGLYFYEARYHDPALGRFITADTIVPNPRDPQDLNRYTYAGNNPLLYTDPTGHFKIKFNKFFKRLGGEVTTGLGLGGQILGFNLSWTNPLLGSALMAGGTATLTQSKSGRSVLAGEIIAVTIAASISCMGCDGGTLTGLALTGFYAGATAGALGGAYTSAMTGRDLLTSVARGALIGGVAGAAGAGFDGWISGVGGSLGGGLTGVLGNSVGGFIGGIGGGAFGGAVGGHLRAGLEGGHIGKAVGTGAWTGALGSAIGQAIGGLAEDVLRSNFYFENQSLWDTMMLTSDWGVYSQVRGAWDAFERMAENIRVGFSEFGGSTSMTLSDVDHGIREERRRQHEMKMDLAKS